MSRAPTFCLSGATMANAEPWERTVIVGAVLLSATAWLAVVVAPWWRAPW